MEEHAQGTMTPPTDAAPQRPKRDLRRQYVIGAIGAFALFLTFALGVYFGSLRPDEVRLSGSDSVDMLGRVTGRDARPPFAFKDVDFARFWDVWDLVHERYVSDPPSDPEMFYGAVSGMVGSLGDPYSVFLDPEFAERFADELEGTFEGIGAEIGIKNGQLTVIAPLAETPAEKAGIKPKDKIYAIDDKDTVGMAVDEAVRLIRGQKGTVVKLLIGRDDLKEPKEFSITRGTILVQPVKWKVSKVNNKYVGVITISHFNENTWPRFNEAVRNVLLEDVDGVVLDLRNDPGGYLDTAVKVGSEWVTEGPIVVQRYSDGREDKLMAEGGGRLAGIPTVVLVNGGSASASEIVAGALKDDGKATIVGEQTYGKGSVQDYLEFGDGSALKLTVALWLTPKGTSIDKQGITPDVEVKMTSEDYENDVDPQMDKALEILAPSAGTAVDAPKEDPRL